MKHLILHLPVPTAGHLALIERTAPDKVHILGERFLTTPEYLSRDARALSPIQNLAALRAIINATAAIYSTRVLLMSDSRDVEHVSLEHQVVMPDEDVTRSFAEKYLPDHKIEWDSAFLRWNMGNVTKEFPVDPDEEVSESELDREFIKEAEEVAKKSPDWWRQVGAVVVKDDIRIAVCNTHTTSPYSSYIDGDPRTPFRPGERIDVSLAQHAESKLVALFAGSSFSMEGASVYVTTFPCPACARLLIDAGVKKVYYSGGYSLVNAREVFGSRGVKVTRVKM